MPDQCPPSAGALCSALAAEFETAGLAKQADALISALADSEVATSPAPRPAPVDRPARVAATHLRPALRSARTFRAGPLAEILAPLVDRLVWTQTPAYVRSPPHAGFLDRYAHATVLGSSADTLLVDESQTAAVGVLLLAPDTLYPHHRHPADEVYLPLTAAQWSSGHDDPFAALAPGRPLHHAPLQPHAVRTGHKRLLALYLWTGDTTTPARLC